MGISPLLHCFNDRRQSPAKIRQTVLCLWRQRRYPSCLRLFLCNYFVFPSPSKYSFTSFTTTPDNKNTAIRFGITISPLNVSAMFHISPRFMVAPTIATSAYKIMNGLLKFNTSCSVKSPANDRGECKTAHCNRSKNRYPATIYGGESADGKLCTCCLAISNRNAAA